MYKIDIAMIAIGVLLLVLSIYLMIFRPFKKIKGEMKYRNKKQTEEYINNNFSKVFKMEDFKDRVVEISYHYDKTKEKILPKSKTIDQCYYSIEQASEIFLVEAFDDNDIDDFSECMEDVERNRIIKEYNGLDVVVSWPIVRKNLKEAMDERDKYEHDHPEVKRNRLIEEQNNLLRQQVQQRNSLFEQNRRMAEDIIHSQEQINTTIALSALAMMNKN